MTPAIGGNTFAALTGMAAIAQSQVRAEIHIQADDFTMPRGRAVLGFAIDSENAAGESISVRPLGKSARRLVPFQLDFASANRGFTLARLKEGDSLVKWSVEGEDPAASRVAVFLAGDANGDFRVDLVDEAIIRDRLGERQGNADYTLDADANRDGAITRADLAVVRMNLGVATSVRRMLITANLSPESDPDGNDVVLSSQVTVVGQTAPRATIAVNGSNALATTDAAGRFQFPIELDAGRNTVHIDARDGFGQRASVEREVRLGDVVLDWNAVMLNVIRDWTTLSNDPFTNRIVPERPPVAARNLAMVHVAMFDALNAFDLEYEPYLVSMEPPEGASPVAAAAVAAQRVAADWYRAPEELAVFDAAVAEALATVPDGPAETLGVEFGRQVADAILALRANDGSRAVVDYTPGTEPGDWNRTFPDFVPPLLPQWPFVTPFAMTSPSQFRVAPPPALDSAEYAAAVNEVKELGSLNSTVRTAEETEIAIFWADGGGTVTPPGHWNQIAADLAIDQPNALVHNARLFALLNIAEADAGIASWDAKYAYDLWRPIDAIRRGDLDGNELTTADPTWTTLIKSPPFPTYTSGHSTFSGAADAVLSFIFGPDTSFSSTSDDHDSFSQRPLADALITTRIFGSFAEAAEEAGRSRILGGIHYSFDNTAGLAAGRAIGQYVVQGFLRPRA